MLVILFLLLSFAHATYAESLDCLCDYVPYQAFWQGYSATGDATIWPSDDPDDNWIAHYYYPGTFEWIMLEISVNEHQEASFQVQIPNEEIRDRHAFLIENSGKLVANIVITELEDNWYSVMAYFLPGESTDLYYLVWVK